MALHSSSSLTMSMQLPMSNPAASQVSMQGAKPIAAKLQVRQQVKSADRSGIELTSPTAHPTSIANVLRRYAPGGAGRRLRAGGR